MRETIKKVPIPVCGVMLGTAALGNLLQSYSEGIRYACGIFAAFLLLLILLKLILFPNMIKEDMGNPIMASVAGTFSMALMILSTYVKPFIGQAAYYIWLFAIGLHIVLILYFTMKFIVRIQMPKVFASYYIVYVGIAVAAITAPVYEKPAIGSAAFWFGLVTLVILLILVTYRYVKLSEVPNLFALIKAVSYLRFPFFPSYAAFTFPFVISAIAAKQTMACTANLGHPLPFLQYVVLAETAIAVILVAYAYIRFLLAIFGQEQK